MQNIQQINFGILILYAIYPLCFSRKSPTKKAGDLHFI